VLEDEEEEKKQDTLSLSPTDDDWKVILEGTRAVRYTANQPVVRQDQEQHQRIYQIAKGYEEGERRRREKEGEGRRRRRRKEEEGGKKEEEGTRA
jgi:hypothetical protein